MSVTKTLSYVCLLLAHLLTFLVAEGRLPRGLSPVAIPPLPRLTECSGSPLGWDAGHRGAGTLKGDVIAPYVEIQSSYGWGNGAGTCLQVDGETLILTAAHVVARNIKVRGAKFTPSKVYYYKQEWDIPFPTLPSIGGWHLDPLPASREADLVWYDPPEEEKGHDLALLRPRHAEGLRAAPLGLSETLEVGEDCWYVGTPNGLHGALERSIINRTDHQMGGNTFTVVNGNGWYGNSGGGLFVKREGGYRLVGVVTRGIGANNPKCPLGAESPVAIRRVLEEYKKAKGVK